MKKYNKDLIGLERNTFKKTSRWAVDQDYAEKLSQEDQEWLAQFNDEFYGAKFRKDKPHLHDTDERRRACYNADNSRRRCTYTILDSGNALVRPRTNLREED